MTGWADVLVELAGAPVGAAIAVGGIWLSNRHSEVTQGAVLESQERQHGERLEFELRSDLLRHTLARRAETYEELLRLCHEAEDLAFWAAVSELPPQMAPIDNTTISDRLRLPVERVRFQVDVHCAQDVRAMSSRFVEAVSAVDETAGPSAWTALGESAARLRAAVIEAAVTDRKTGLNSDGLGGM